MTRTQSRDNFAALGSLRSALPVGITVGIGLSLMFSVWLFVANRMPSLERYANLRNAAAAGAFFLVSLLPLACYRNAPVKLFLSGFIGCAIASLCFFACSMRFNRLENRVSAFQVFVMGGALYGLAAILVWLGTLLRSARIHHISMQPATRRRGQ
jgi:hypothetical protein